MLSSSLFPLVAEEASLPCSSKEASKEKLSFVPDLAFKGGHHPRRPHRRAAPRPPNKTPHKHRQEAKKHAEPAGTDHDISDLDFSLSAECEPLLTVAGCVNAVSGHFFQMEKDLVDPSIDPLPLFRFYDSHNETESMLGLGYGTQFPLWASDLEKGSRHSYALISEREGVLLPYRNQEKDKAHYHIDPRLLKKGYTNLSRAALSGQSNFINWTAVFYTTNKFPGHEWAVRTGNGGVRIYGVGMAIDKERRKKLNIPTRNAFLLTEERKPNGNRLLFSYEHIHGLPRLVKVRTVGREKDDEINSLHFEYSPHHRLAKNDCGAKVEYKLEELALGNPHGEGARKMERKILKKVRSSDRGETSFHTIPFDLHKVRRIDRPEGRFLEIEYDREGKVHQLFQPVGKEGERICTHKFLYNSSQTLVMDALHNGAFYHFDDHSRLVCLDHLDSHGQLLFQKRFEWSKREGQEGWLRAKSMGKGDNLVYLKTYRYDGHGNITRETTYGNLTGEREESFTNKNATDSTYIEYSYTPDERHLIKEKRMPGGWTIRYDYLPKTNLCTKVLHIYDGSVQERFFYTYGDFGELKTAIEDDGQREEEGDLSGITYRRLKVIEPVQTKGPSFGRPQEEKHYFHSWQGWQFLKRIEYSYDERGNETKRRCYNKDTFCYETTKQYDSQRRVIEESDEAGRVKRFAYDGNGNTTQEEVVGSGLVTCYTYDLANRCTKQEEKHANGECLTTTYTYNALNELTAVIDPYGSETAYLYDPLGRETTCLKPPLKDWNNRPSVGKEYNLLNQMTKRTDEEGQSSFFRYNLYGSPTCLTHPDGSTLSFIYYPNGKLKQKRLADGSTLRYAYNPRGRLTLIEWFDPSGNLVANEKRGYKGPLLMERKDRNGVETRYTYDGAGRKTWEVVAGGTKITCYSYDGLDRLIETFYKLNDVEGQLERLSYDGLSRLTSKTWWDVHGHLFGEERYSYDIQGNVSTIAIRQNDQETAHHHFHYNSDGTLHQEIDPLRNITEWGYDRRHVNGLGQRVMRRLTKDPLGRMLHEVEDPWHRLVRRDLRIGETTFSCNHFYHDNVGNLIKEHALVMKEGQPLREYFIERRYNSKGELLSEIEQPEGRATHFAYDNRGHLIEKKKPDGISIYYTYDCLSRLIEKRSSDGTIWYQYHYAAFDRPTAIVDRVSGIVQRRSYNCLGNLIEEELSPNLIIKYSYDALERLTHLTLSDGSSIQYSYDAFHLRQAKRLNNQGEVLFECRLDSYDSFGNAREEITPAGKVRTTYDALGRAVHIDAEKWQEKQEGFDAKGNLLRSWQKDPSGEETGEFAYDVFDHLTKDFEDTYLYDSLGNCLYKNGQEEAVNGLNHTLTSQGSYSYDSNGNLTSQSHPPSHYAYDALNRLIYSNREGRETTYVYDSSNRCLQIKGSSGTQQLIYQYDQEIGSFSEGRLQQFRLIHPTKERTFAIELQGEPFFVIQDFRGNISALQRKDGSLAEWTCYSAFGQKRAGSHVAHSLFNPWRFANRREVEGLSLFTHRLYHPSLRRWMTADPLGFQEGLNLYLYTYNNPFYYKDLDGQFAIALPIFYCTIGTTLGPLIFPAFATVATTVLIAYSVNRLVTYMDARLNQIRVDEEAKAEEREKERDKENFKFPENLDDLLPELPRDKKGHIYPADNIRIRPEKHDMQPGEKYNPRHHDSHYHVETRRNPAKKSWKDENKEIIKPPNYEDGMGTGFLPGEYFPGAP